MSDERDENPELRIPEDESGVWKIASEGKEQGMTEEARRAISKAQARLIGDL